jgi:hypothetical protein
MADTDTATPADCVLFDADVWASTVALGPFLAADETALLLTANEVSGADVIFMMTSKTTINVVSRYCHRQNHI